MQDKIKLTSKKVLREKRLRKIFLILIILFLLLLLLFYMVVGIVYNRGNFSITLDENMSFDRGLIMYDNPDDKAYRRELYAEEPGNFDNISGYWLPEDITASGGGSHNGKSYLAYTFYVENIGEEIRDYWYEVYIEGATRGVEDAVRIRVYRNDEYVTFAKARATGGAERDTTPFITDTLAGRVHIENFWPESIDKYTLVVWIEGSDAECTDDILGGEFRVRMRFNSEYIEENQVS